MQQNGSAAGPEYLAPWLTYLASPTFRLFILISACREMSPTGTDTTYAAAHTSRYLSAGIQEPRGLPLPAPGSLNHHRVTDFLFHPSSQQ